MKAWVSLVFLGSAACVRLDTTVRTERGPVLQTLQREQAEPGGVTGELSVPVWPTLSVTLMAYDVCREQTVEVLTEETVTERTSSSGPALSMGIANVLASGILFFSSLAVSNEPNRGSIDVGGRYGPSARQYVQGAGWVTLAIGVPALVVGVIGALRSGERSTSKQVEQLASQHERPCHSHPLVGPVVINNEPAPRSVVDGSLELDVTAMVAPIEDLRFFGRTVTLDDASMRVLDQVNACIELAHTPLMVTTPDERLLYARQALEVRCSAVSRLPNDGAISKELARRQEARSEDHAAPQVGSFEEAMRVFAPTVTLTAGSKELATLESSVGQSAVFKGVVISAPRENVGVVSIGDRQVPVFVPLRQPWSDSFVAGARVEGVALVSDRQRADEPAVPMLRLLWLRPSF